MRKKQAAISSKWAPRIAAIFATAGIIAGVLTMWPTVHLALFAPTPAIASAGSIMQDNALVGFGVGARRDKQDPTRLDFTEITNASKLNYNKEFEYQNYVLKLSRVHIVRDAASFGAGRTLEGVRTTIVRER
jgi:hypothetical protein